MTDEWERKLVTAGYMYADRAQRHLAKLKRNIHKRLDWSQRKESQSKSASLSSEQKKMFYYDDVDLHGSYGRSPSRHSHHHGSPICPRRGAERHLPRPP